MTHHKVETLARAIFAADYMTTNPRTAKAIEYHWKRYHPITHDACRKKAQRILRFLSVLSPGTPTK